MGDLAIDIGFLVKPPEVGENYPIVVRIRSHRKINVAMELTAPKVLGVEAIRTPALVIDLDAVLAGCRRRRR